MDEEQIMLGIKKLLKNCRYSDVTWKIEYCDFGYAMFLSPAISRGYIRFFMDTDMMSSYYLTEKGFEFTA